MHKDPKQIQSLLINFRKVFSIIIVLNIIFLTGRSIFDFLGFMYGMIAADIIYLLFLIIGLFGAYQYRANYIVISVVITIFWVLWNIFVICVYSNFGFLNRYDPYVLNLNTGSQSWWYKNSIGCSEQIESRLTKLKYDQEMEQIKNLLVSSTSQVPTQQETQSITNMTNANIIETLIRNNCVFPFYTIEIAQSGFLILLGILAIIFGVSLANAFNEDDDTFDYIGGFDSVNVVANSEQSTVVPRNNHHIRLEPLYATNY